jgi:hypothetical protein
VALGVFGIVNATAILASSAAVATAVEAAGEDAAATTQLLSG